MIVFYEKPGCITNTRQKKLLAQAGFEVDARSMLVEPWQAKELEMFFADLPVEAWFNKAAPQVKSGDVDPSKLAGSEAISLMLENPLLIRRPLLKTDKGVGVGFEAETLDRLGIGNVDAATGKEGCSNTHKSACPEPQKA